MQISWQPGFSLSRKPVRRSTGRRTKRGARGNAARPHTFVFIADHPVRNHGEIHSSSVTTFTHSGAPVEPIPNDRASSDPNNVKAFEETQPSIETPHWALSDESLIRSGESPDLEPIYGTTEPRSYQYNSEDRCASLRLPGSTTDRQLQIFGSNVGLGTSYKKPSVVAVSDLPNMSCFLSDSVPPRILYNSLSQRFRPILDRYNREFCKIPLTSHLRINPFRYRTDLDPEPIFLVHAVMALAGHHVESTSTQDHRHAALKLLRESLETYRNARDGYSMLDTIIILFSLDETQSTLGNWRTHLVGAYGLLEACGGIEGWATSARAEVQVGLLTWWDAIISLVSREECVFPYSYFEAVLSNHNGRGWDYFGLCGCPSNLVKIVMQLARLSAEKRKSSPMRYVTFDPTVISEIERSLESWHHISPATAFQDEESMQKDQDSMHCSEAWRNGLLLYIYRVFQWEPGSSISMHILYRARVIVDHVVACRDESMVSRQALLPLFFAGCELRDQSLRKKIVKFCSVWNERTRYHMFSSTIPLLEEVWAEQETKGFENVWWGQVVDKQHISESGYPLQMRICFG
ncbi:fungal-specific transcription factor domain-containing protein [Lipomyces kononenkoae]